MRTRVKICGITRPEDGLVAAQLGADAIGLVFYPTSPRAVTIEQAQAVCKMLPPFVTRVGLFVDASRDKVESVLAQVALDVLQFHGNEQQEDCEGYDKPYLKALRMAPELDVERVVRKYASASGILLDSYQAGVAGGTGKTFDWTRVPHNIGKPLILAGGLEAGNVSDAIETVHPWAVDVSGGVESSKGIKDAGKIAAFMNEVQNVGTGKTTD